MPKGPRGEKRPADVIGMSVKVMRPRWQLGSKVGSNQWRTWLR
jgi:hypothetical protein